MDEPDGRRDSAGLAWRVTGRLAALVLTGVVLITLRPILIPLVLAILLSFLVLPLVAWMTRRGVPGALAIIGAETAATLPFLGLFLVFSATVGPVSQALPKYKDRLIYQANQTIEAIVDRVGDTEQREVVRREIGENLLPGAFSGVVQFFQDGVSAATTAVGYLFLTLLLCGFILVEGRRFHEKFEEAYGANHPLLAALQGIGHDVRVYVVAKTLISALTGFFVWIFLELCDVDFAVFWGLLAFPLNFVPTVGAIVASLPPIVVAMVDPAMTAWGATGVAIGLLAINGAIGSVLDPRYVGQAVKVSPLVVFLSMLVWGTLWGPIGMILAVPIMVSVKVVCARIPALEPIATLMKG